MLMSLGALDETLNPLEGPLVKSVSSIHSHPEVVKDLNPAAVMVGVQCVHITEISHLSVGNK